VQIIVYFFIFLFGVAFSVTAYFALTFTMVEAVLSGFIAASWAVIIYERSLRHRAEARLEKGIEDLSALLSTDAKAGQILSKRVNVISEEKAGDRLEVMEADVSVLGTVVRQVAEAVAQLEEAQEKIAQQMKQGSSGENFKTEGIIKEPSVSASDVKKAIKDNRVNFYAQPIVSLPQREVQAYDLKAYLELENKKTIEYNEFIRTLGNDALVREVDKIGFTQVIKFAKNNLEEKSLLNFYIPISKASLSNNSLLNWLVDQLETSKALAQSIKFVIEQVQLDSFNSLQKAKLALLIDCGAGVSIANTDTLRHDFAVLNKAGVSSIRVDGATFVDNPEKYSDFHGADVADYIARYNIDLIICDVNSEEQVLILLEDGIKLIKGDYIVPFSLASSMIEVSDNLEQAKIAK